MTLAQAARRGWPLLRATAVLWLTTAAAARADRGADPTVELPLSLMIAVAVAVLLLALARRRFRRSKPRRSPGQDDSPS